jgi:hypothetical protein
MPAKRYAMSKFFRLANIGAQIGVVVVPLSVTTIVGAQPPSQLSPEIAANLLGLGAALVYSGACRFKVNMAYLIQVTSVDGLDQAEIQLAMERDLEELEAHPDGTCKVAYKILNAFGAISGEEHARSRIREKGILPTNINSAYRRPRDKAVAYKSDPPPLLCENKKIATG